MNTLTVLTAGIATLAIYSFLVRENPIYRFFEHFFIGIASGLGLIVVVKYTLWPKVIVPLLLLDQGVYPDGTAVVAISSARYLLLLPVAFGLLFYTVFFPKLRWLSRLVIGFSLGVAGGMSFEAFFNEVTPQLLATAKPLAGSSWTQLFSNFVFVSTFFAVLYYFFFTIRKQEGAAAKAISRYGRIMMMICFGAFFGSTVAARMALLVERLQFLYGDFWQALIGLFR